MLVNYVSMVFFLFDIGICFFTSYLDISSGDVIFKLDKIALNYVLNGSFIPDILSTFPLKSWYVAGREQDEINEGLDLFLTILGILKVQRFLRTRAIISKLDMTVEWKATLSLLYMIILLLVYIHLQACVFWWVIERDTGTPEEWVPQTDYMYGNTMLH